MSGSNITSAQRAQNFAQATRKIDIKQHWINIKTL